MNQAMSHSNRKCCLSIQQERQLDRSCTGPVCSALSVNCFQLPFFRPRANLICDYYNPTTTTTKLATADWMGLLLKERPNVGLRDLILVGTHDSGTYSISSWQPYSAIGRTQEWNILQQLEAGARYLDLRIAPDNNSSNYNNNNNNKKTIRIRHGCMTGSDSLEDMLYQVQDFLSHHTQEFVLLEVTPEFGCPPLTADDKRTCLELFQTIFGSQMLPWTVCQQVLSTQSSSSTTTTPTPTLALLLTQGYRVAIFLHSRFFDIESTHGLDLTSLQQQHSFVMDRSDVVRSKWHNTHNVSKTLLDWNLQEVEKYGHDKTHFLVHQLVGTPGVGGWMDVLSALVGINTLRPDRLATQLYHPQVLNTFLKQQQQQQQQRERQAWNILQLDFIDLCPSTIDYAISLNFCNDKLDILLAVVQRSFAARSFVNVTQKVQEHTHNNHHHNNKSPTGMLFLTNIASDLGLLDDAGTLVVAYKLKLIQGNKYQVMTVPFDAETTILISAFVSTSSSTSTTPSTTTTTTTSNNNNNINGSNKYTVIDLHPNTSGYIANGQSSPTKDALVQDSNNNNNNNNTKGVILKYDYTGPQCKVEIEPR